MEGTQFPKFSFKDLNGNLVSNESMKGKIIVIKCWYIHCTPCIKEFPQVNQTGRRIQRPKRYSFYKSRRRCSGKIKSIFSQKTFSIFSNSKHESVYERSITTQFIPNTFYFKQRRNYCKSFA